MAEAPFTNDGSFFEQFKKMQEQAEQSAEKPLIESAADRREEAAQPPTQESASAQCSKSDSPALPASESSADNDFIASTSFSGSMEGFVFSTGGHGTGYYKDKPLHLRQKQAQAKPVVLKTNASIIKGLQRRAIAPVPDAKKRKTDADSSKPGYLKEMERYRAMACSSDTKHDRPLVK